MRTVGPWQSGLNERQITNSRREWLNAIFNAFQFLIFELGQGRTAKNADGQD